MPLYEYKCNDCGAICEILQKVSDSPATECEKCGGGLDKLISSPAIKFKGAGFYINDYAAGKTPATATAESSQPSKKETGTTATSSSPKSE